MPDPLDAFTADYMNADKYPGADRGTELLQDLIQFAELKTAVDIGGGANPLVSREFASANLDRYELSTFPMSNSPRPKATRTRSRST